MNDNIVVEKDANELRKVADMLQNILIIALAIVAVSFILIVFDDRQIGGLMKLLLGAIVLVSTWVVYLTYKMILLSAKNLANISMRQAKSNGETDLKKLIGILDAIKTNNVLSAEGGKKSEMVKSSKEKIEGVKVEGFQEIEKPDSEMGVVEKSIEMLSQSGFKIKEVEEYVWIVKNEEREIKITGVNNLFTYAKIHRASNKN